MTRRLLPPALGDTETIFGVTYTAQAGSVLNVPDNHAAVLAANKWVDLGPVDPVANARPGRPKRGDRFIDTALGYTIVFDGLVWRNPVTGASV